MLACSSSFHTHARTQDNTCPNPAIFSDNQHTIHPQMMTISSLKVRKVVRITCMFTDGF